MKQSLQLRLGQSLTMTPQLQQAIRLLQLSSLELQTEIQQALESNLMLEVKDDNAMEGPQESDYKSEDGSDTAPEERELSIEAGGGDELGQNDIPDELPVDSSWDDIYDSGSYTSGSGQGSDNEGREFENFTSATEGLHEHLTWQMSMAPFSDSDIAIAETIIDAIDDDGYLSVSLSDILASAQADYPDLDMEEVEAVLHRVQNFDPPGIAARSLQESMAIQLKQLDPKIPNRDHALVLVQQHFDLLANHEYSQLMRRMKLNNEQLQAVIQLIQSLNPRPGGILSNNNIEYIIPDVFVRKVKGRWKVELNPEVTPKLSINSLYAKMIQRANTSKDNLYLKDQLQEARWFIKSLRSRNETLLRVAKAIVERQRGFLEHGEEAMKAMVMHDIAQELEMHESTISRVTTKKYMHTPRGIYELKFFFSSHVSTSSGGECSSTAIRAMIKKLVSAENPSKPLSDSKLADMLAEKGIQVARRTIAKYREALSIPPSNERKRLI